LISLAQASPGDDDNWTISIRRDGQLIPLGGGMETVMKTADESVTNNATVQDDDVLSFAVAANSSYIWELTLMATYSTAGGSPEGLRITFEGPSGTVGRFGDVGSAVGNELASTST